MSREQQTAAIILQQLGGNKFLAMTGATHLAAGHKKGVGDYISMKLRRNQARAKWLMIYHNAMDTYDMVFQGIEKGKLVERARHDGIYDDMLQPLFTKVTGLNTKL